MLRRSLILLLFLASIAIAQYTPSGFYYECILFPSKQGKVCYVTYRAAYNQFVFIRENEKFTARFSFSVEAQDGSGKVISREIISRDIIVDDYEKTSRGDIFVQGFITLNLPDGAVKIQPAVTDLSSDKEMMLYPYEIIGTKGTDKAFLPPLIMEEKGANCSSGSKSRLVNYEGNLPLSKNSYGMIIPVSDTTIKAIDVVFINNGRQSGSFRLKESEVQSLQIEHCGDDLAIKNSGDSIRTDNFRAGNIRTRNFILNNVNTLLFEGKLQIKVSNAADSSQNRAFFRYVRWYNKPRVLMNPVLAARLLRYITDDKAADDFKRIRKDEIRDSLFVFWKKLDPTPKTAFNELMEEFYQRADYALENFSVLSGANGAETDRGKIYILYGRPDDIKRTYNEGVVTEIWIYGKKQFVFLDKSGIGNFQLVKA